VNISARIEEARVDAHRQVVGDLAEHVSAQAARRVAVGDGLVVRDEDQHLDTEVLETDPVRERAEEVADVQRPRRSVAGQDPKRTGEASIARSSWALRSAPATCDGVVAAGVDNAGTSWSSGRYVVPALRRDTDRPKAVRSTTSRRPP